MSSLFEARLDEMQNDFQTRLRLAHQKIRLLTNSALELALGVGLITCQSEFGPARVVHNSNGAPIGHGLFIIPQFTVLSYRADFAMFLRSGLSSSRLLVEADGAYWHDRNDAQRDRDSLRDTKLLHAGWPVMRFSEAQIKDDAGACADDVWDRLYTSWRHKTLHIDQFSESPA